MKISVDIPFTAIDSNNKLVELKYGEVIIRTQNSDKFYASSIPRINFDLDFITKNREYFRIQFEVGDIVKGRSDKYNSKAPNAVGPGEIIRIAKVRADHTGGNMGDLCFNNKMYIESEDGYNGHCHDCVNPASAIEMLIYEQNEPPKLPFTVGQPYGVWTAREKVGPSENAITIENENHNSLIFLTKDDLLKICEAKGWHK